MANKKAVNNDKGFEAVEHTLTKAEHFFEENQKIITIIVVAIFVVVAGYYLFTRFYLNSREAEAKGQMFVAEQYFEKDSFKLALNGDGNYLGFIQIIDDYGITKSAKLAKYYAGISYLQLGQYENAIEYLKKFKSKNKLVMPVALGAIGDSYSQLANYKEAAVYYKKAAEYSFNNLTTPYFMLKAAQVYENLQEYKSALKICEEIKKEFPRSAAASQIDKYITKLKLFIQ